MLPSNLVTEASIELWSLQKTFLHLFLFTEVAEAHYRYLKSSEVIQYIPNYFWGNIRCREKDA